eukprot:TRINITY_DN3594_c3_g1_i1.p1 TRINITY_DN3594_c3_g1~~TRINITY_DN3594_c3_g1_i1.p1  ORF type:complete len:595 (+),score=88.99 TRINITY_DN3594_c3_g1_i1:80-1864(+)
MKRCQSAAACNGGSHQTLLLTVVGVRNIPHFLREKPAALAVEAKLGTVTAATSEHKPIVQAASHTIACTFEETLELPFVNRDWTPLKISLRLLSLQNDKIYGKAKLSISTMGNATQRKQWVPLTSDSRSQNGDVHVSWAFTGITRHDSVNSIPRPKSAMEINSVSSQHDSGGVRTILPGPGTLHLHLTKLVIPFSPICPNEIATITLHCSFGGAERFLPAIPFERQISLDNYIEYDVVYSARQRLIHFSLWGQREMPKGEKKGLAVYEDLLLGEIMFEVNSGGPHSSQVAKLTGGIELTFNYRLTYQKPLQEGSSGRPRSAHPRRLLKGNSADPNIAIKINNTNQRANSYQQPPDDDSSELSAEEVKMDFEKSSNNIDHHTQPVPQTTPVTLEAIMLEVKEGFRYLEHKFDTQIVSINNRISLVESKVQALEIMNQASPPRSPSSPPPLVQSPPPLLRKDSPRSQCSDGSDRSIASGDVILESPPRLSGLGFPPMLDNSRPSSAGSVNDFVNAAAVKGDISGVYVTEEQLRNKFQDLAKTNNWVPRSALKDFYLSYATFDESDHQVDRTLSNFTTSDRVPYDEFARLALFLAKR